MKGLMTNVIFTPEAIKNISKTGNVWGTTTQYIYNFTIKLPFNYKARFQQKSKNDAWGRFGGGWNWKVGAQCGGTTLIIDVFVMSIRIGKR